MSTQEISDYLFQKSGVQFPNLYLELIQAFSKRYGDLAIGLESFLDAVGLAWLGNIKEYREYEGVPCEAELVLNTGSDGECVGWVNLCPEVKEFKKPTICFIPLGLDVEFLGVGDKQALENLLNEESKVEGYEGVDLDIFLDFGIDYKAGNRSYHILEPQLSSPQKLPIEIPKGYRYEPSIDGIGVCAPESEFLPETKLVFSQRDSIPELINTAEQLVGSKKRASALIVLKALDRLVLYTSEPDTLQKICELKTIAYEGLNRSQLTDIALNRNG